MCLRTRKRGQALVWFMVMVPFFLSVIGLAIDGQPVLRAHRRAQLAADAAARTGAEQIQIGDARGQPGAPDILDRAAAQQAAARYVAAVYPDLQVTTQADQQHLVVVVTQPVTPAFLQLVHVSMVQVQARPDSHPRGGD